MTVTIFSVSVGSRPQDHAPRPQAKVVLTDPVHLLAFGLGTGLAPKAPGTFGTLLGIPLWWALSGLDLSSYLAAVVLISAAGVWICGNSAKRLGLHDCPGIVFDEIAGFLVTATPLLPALGLEPGWGPFPIWTGVLAAFLLFRLFDIWKPWPIRVLDEKVHGGTGIMLDDLVAGLYAAALLYLLHFLPI